MPTYEYECKKCSHTFEAFQSINDEPLKKCPKCGKSIRRIIFGGAGVIFKGSGFYVTDKNKGSQTRGAAGSASKEAKKPAETVTGDAVKSDGGTPAHVSSGNDGSKEAGADKTAATPHRDSSESRSPSSSTETKKSVTGAA
jgi:putative FmdB family regulatory protein